MATIKNLLGSMIDKINTNTSGIEQVAEEIATHVTDAKIHVTQSDKERWDNLVSEVRDIKDLLVDGNEVAY